MNGSSRERILAAIRRAQGDRQGGVEGDVTTRLSAHPRGPLPRLDDDMGHLLQERLAAVACSVAVAGSADELDARLGEWLKDAGITRLVRAESALLGGVTWPATCTLQGADSGKVTATSVVEAFCAVAETGSLVMLSHRGSPTTLNFLPDNYIAIVRRERIVRHIEDAWALIRREYGDMPRAINFITGPSRTADVEQTIQLGAHGPRQMHVIVYG